VLFIKEGVVRGDYSAVWIRNKFSAVYYLQVSDYFS
jgi:hypothetical protein